jgi:glycerophosphoryl diester phosphodiesterase
VHELEPGLARYAIVSSEHFAGAGVGGPQAVLADLQGHGFAAVAVNNAFLSEALLALLKEAGFMVGVWVINDVERMWQFERMGVDFVTSDRPGILVPAYRQGRG